MYGKMKSDSTHRRPFIALAILILATFSGCQGSSNLSRGAPRTEGEKADKPGQWKTDPLTSASVANSGGAPKSGGDFAKSLDTTAKALEKVPTENSAQQAAMAAAIASVRQMGQRYAQLKPNLSLPALSQWLTAQAQERQRLKAAADACRQAGLAATADALNELSARQDVLMFRRAVPYGGIRHAYLTSAGQGTATYLEGYSFGGIAFQVFDKSLTSRGQVIDQPLYECQMKAGEGEPVVRGVTNTFWIKEKEVSMLFLDSSSDCHGQTQVSTLGYGAKTTGVVTARPLFWLRRSERPDGDDFHEFLESLKPWNLLNPQDTDSNFADSFYVPNEAAAQSVVNDTDKKYHSEPADNGLTPIVYVP